MCELAPYLVKYDYSEKHSFENLLIDLYRDDDITINNTNLMDTIDVLFLYIIYKKVLLRIKNCFYLKTYL